METGWTQRALERRDPSGQGVAAQHGVADEVAVEIHLDQQSAVVTMASPVALDDLAVGFVLSEGYLAAGAPIQRVETYAKHPGFIVNVIAEGAPRPAIRARSVAARASCGLCGVTSLDDAVANLAPVTPRPMPTASAVHSAAAALRDHQPLNQQTRSVHAAAWCDPDGRIARVREDIGRHNALDKLLGARVRSGDTSDGFVLLSSRLSYELVQKAAAHDVATLVAVSAPTTLAIDMARSAGMNLVAIARDDNHSVFARNGDG